MTRNLSGLRAIGLLGMAFLLGGAGVVARMWEMPSDAPVARLVATLSSYVQHHPEEPHPHYLLARVHGLAYVLKTSQLSYWDGRGEPMRGLPEAADKDMQWRHQENGPPPTQAELNAHLCASVGQFEKAVALDHDRAMYQLGFAYILEIGADAADKIDVLPTPYDGDFKPPDKAERERLEGFIAKLGDENAATRETAATELVKSLATAAPLLFEHRKAKNKQQHEEVRKLLAKWWREVSIARYFRAYQAAIAKDRESKEQPMMGLKDLLGYEAGTSYLRLVRARGAADKAETDRIAAVEKNMKSLEALPRNDTITPIIFSLTPSNAVGELLDDTTIVSFDLAGAGLGEHWSWIKPSTALLVWDPQNKKQITSGRQLFGSATWWMFFEDGYQALDALDDDRDGELSGKELDGIAAWFDRNGNGICDDGEVVSLKSLGIAAISVRALSRDGRCPTNPVGLRLLNGSTLPTYDWVTEPVTAPSPTHSCPPTPTAGKPFHDGSAASVVH